MNSLTISEFAEHPNLVTYKKMCLCVCVCVVRELLDETKQTLRHF